VVDNSHYAVLPIQPIFVVELLGMKHHIASAFQYILRHQRKGGLEDLEKALWYLERFQGLEGCSAVYNFEYTRRFLREYARACGLPSELQEVVGCFVNEISRAQMMLKNYLVKEGAWK